MYPAAAILMLVFQVLGFGRTLPWSVLPLGLGHFFWMVISVGFLVWLKKPGIIKSDTILNLAARRFSLMGFALFILPFLAFDVFRFSHFGYGFPTAHLIILSVIVPFLRRDRLWVSFLLSLLLLVASIIHFPLHPDRSDMLPVIQTGLDFWGAGKSSYSIFQMGDRTNFMSYLPGTMFFHLPAWWMGMDLRWNTVFLRLCWMLLILFVLKRRHFWAERNGVMTALHFFALSPYLNFRHDLYFEGFFLLLVLFMVVPKRRWLWLPLMIWTRQWSWVLTPFFLGAQILQKRRIDGQTALKCIAGLLGVIACFLVLLKQSTFSEFMHATFWFQDVITKPEYSGDYGLTLAPVFYAVHISTVLQKLQGIIALILFFLALRELKKKQRTDWLRWAGCCWVWFLMLNPHFWLYFWLSPALYFTLLPFTEKG